MASYGPVSLVVISFPGNEFKGEIAPALEELISSGTVRIIDLAFVSKDGEGNLVAFEINDLDDDVYGQIDPYVEEVSSLLGEEDIASVGEMLDLNSSAALFLFENSWAAKFAAAVRNANGQLVMSETIPAAVVNAIADGELSA